MKQLLFYYGIFIFITGSGCSKHNNNVTPITPQVYSLDSTKISLHYDQEHQFLLRLNNEVLSKTAAGWVSSDTTVGTVDSSGFFKAKKIGNTRVKATIEGDTVSAAVIVIPYTAFFREPDTDFGADSSAVAAYELRTRASIEVVDPQTLQIFYHGENAYVSSVIYTFSNGKLIGSGVSFGNNAAFPNMVITFYNERYPLYLAPRQGFRLYHTSSGTTQVSLDYTYNTAITAGYSPI